MNEQGNKSGFLTPLFSNLKPIGVVFGDIGTSPIYTLSIVFSMVKPTFQNVLGVISLIFWTLVIISSIQYAYLAMKFSIRGEGGVIILYRFLISRFRGKKFFDRYFIFILILVISFFIGDSVITPAISIISANEGLKLAYEIDQGTVVLLSVVICFLLFLIQRGGAEKISFLFSPVMFVWFLALGIFGIIFILKEPKVLLALNPYFAIKFLLDNKFEGILALSGTILSVTGAEALYADIGHLGVSPIRKSWFFFVFPSLILNYLGQGAFVLSHSKTELVFFGLAKEISDTLYVPFVFLSSLATIIASQSVITAFFSIIYQSIVIHIFPRVRVEHKSPHLYGQIYIPQMNWILFSVILLVMFIFRTSENLGHAYGFSVNVVIAFTAISLSLIFWREKEISFFLLSLLCVFSSLLYLVATSTKIPHGGYVSVAVASVPFAVMMVFKLGGEKIAKALSPMDYYAFLELYQKIYSELIKNKIKGTAIFLVRDTNRIPPYVMNIIGQGIIYEENILMSVRESGKPYGVEVYLTDVGNGLKIFIIEHGYMEFVDVAKIFQEYDIKPVVIFYGIEDIITKNPLVKFYSIIKKLAPSFETFYNFPPVKLHGVVTKLVV